MGAPGIFSNNGAANVFRYLDWKVIHKVECIEPGPGTMMGRLVGKTYKRTIGHGLDDFLVIVEKTKNGTPLTYVTENNEELEPITPSMFKNVFGGVKPNKFVSGGSMKKELRKKYLPQVLSRAKDELTSPIKIGELIGSDRKKKLCGLSCGVGSRKRVAKVKTRMGMDTRPVQLLYPLELGLEACKFLEACLQKSIDLICGRI